jgi:hypothetical protein
MALCDEPCFARARFRLGADELLAVIEKQGWMRSCAAVIVAPTRDDRVVVETVAGLTARSGQKQSSAGARGRMPPGESKRGLDARGEQSELRVKREERRETRAICHGSSPWIGSPVTVVVGSLQPQRREA